MECAYASSSYSDYEGWDFEPSSTFPKAKKNWKCGECGRVISVGEKYNCYTGKWEGRFVSERTCMDCYSVTKYLFKGFTFGQVWDDLNDHLWNCEGEISYEAVSRLTPTARSKVCDMIEKRWPDMESEHVKTN